MNKIRQRRLIFISIFAMGLTLATSLILYSLKQNINVFLSPAEVYATNISHTQPFRLGGMVKKNSVHRDPTGLGVHFVVTDFKKEISVYFKGILPDLFREGKGMIAQGKLNEQGMFIAREVLAKHDENYMPMRREKT